MIVICASDNFYEWTLLFLESLYLTNGIKYKVLLNGLDLPDKMIGNFRKAYSNLEVINKDVDYEYIRKTYEKTPKEIKKTKRRLADGFKKDNRWWSQYILHHRTEGLVDAMDDNPDEDWFILYDVDFMFRKSIDPLIDLVTSHDVSLFFRPSLKALLKDNKDKKEFMRVGGGLSGYNGEKGREFVHKWWEILNTKDTIDLPVDVYIWDQAAMYKTFLHFKDMKNEDETPYMNWGGFDVDWISAGYHAWKPVWGGHRKASNIHVEIGSKDNVKVLNCHTRRKLRNYIFIPEFTRIKEEKVNEGREDLNRLFMSEKISKKAIEEDMAEEDQKKANKRRRERHEKKKKRRK